MDLRQSMQNGGGPACLRQRIILTEEELAHTHPGVFLSDDNYPLLVEWANRYYREKLHPDELHDPELYHETLAALNDLVDIMQLPPFYDFQRLSERAYAGV